MRRMVIDARRRLIVGYTDIQAEIDLSTFRRIPWENDIPFFLVKFPEKEANRRCSFLTAKLGNLVILQIAIRVLNVLVCACPRSLLKGILKDLHDIGSAAMAGIEYEFCTAL